MNDDSLTRLGGPYRPYLGSRSAVAAVDAAAVLITGTVLVVTGLGLTGAVRIVCTIVFVSFVPGWALLDHLQPLAGPSRPALAVALSFTIVTAAALILLLLRAWQPFVLLYAIGVLSLVGLVSHLAGELDVSFTAAFRRPAISPKDSR